MMKYNQSQFMGSNYFHNETNIPRFALLFVHTLFKYSNFVRHFNYSERHMPNMSSGCDSLSPTKCDVFSFIFAWNKLKQKVI